MGDDMLACAACGSGYGDSGGECGGMTMTRLGFVGCAEGLGGGEEEQCEEGEEGTVWVGHCWE